MSITWAKKHNKQTEYIYKLTILASKLKSQLWSNGQNWETCTIKLSIWKQTYFKQYICPCTYFVYVHSTYTSKFNIDTNNICIMIYLQHCQKQHHCIELSLVNHVNTDGHYSFWIKCTLVKVVFSLQPYCA